jgi:hypothetical protein
MHLNRDYAFNGQPLRRSAMSHGDARIREQTETEVPISQQHVARGWIAVVRASKPHTRLTTEIEPGCESLQAEAQVNHKHMDSGRPNR